MENSIQVPRIKIGKRQVNIFPLWIVFLLVGFLIGLEGMITVLREVSQSPG